MASEPRNAPTECRDSTPTSSATPASPMNMPPRADGRAFSEASRNGAKAATKSDAGAISTAVRPDGTSSSPNVMRLKGSAIASTPSSTARPGRARTSMAAARPPPPPEGGGARLGAAVAPPHARVEHDARQDEPQPHDHRGLEALEP